jgi:hypothetical protein
MSLINPNPNITLHSSLKLRFYHWVVQGIDKKVKEELLNSYARAIELDVLKLDPKILQILSESAVKGITYVPDNKK